jgi:hypothetical protein
MATCRSIRSRGHGDVQVDPVEQRPRDAGGVASDRTVVAAAVPSGAPAPAAGAGVGGRDELKVRGKDAGGARACDDDASLLDHLAESLEATPVELGQLIEKQHAAMGQ